MTEDTGMLNQEEKLVGGAGDSGLRGLLGYNRISNNDLTYTGSLRVSALPELPPLQHV